MSTDTTPSSSASAGQLSIALMAEARRMHQRGGTIGADEHGFRAVGDRLAAWALDVRRLGLEAEQVTEYAVQMPGGGMHVRVSDPKVERIYPLAEWLKHSNGNGTRVYRRRVIVVEDWEEVTEP